MSLMVPSRSLVQVIGNHPSHTFDTSNTDLRKNLTYRTRLHRCDSQSLSESSVICTKDRRWARSENVLALGRMLSTTSSVKTLGSNSPREAISRSSQEKLLVSETHPPRYIVLASRTNCEAQDPQVDIGLHTQADLHRDVNHNGGSRSSSSSSWRSSRTFEPVKPSSTNILTEQSSDHITTDGSLTDRNPFRRWLSTLRRRHQPILLARTVDRWPIDKNDGVKASIEDSIHRQVLMKQRVSTSDSSSHAFVTAVKSASVTVAETGQTSRTWIRGRLIHMRRVKFPRSERDSVDSAGSFSETTVDEMTWMRAVQRRKILEEIIESEESYVADLKILVNVYFTLVTSSNARPGRIRTSIRENVAQIVQLHETLLGDLYRAVPNSEYNDNHARDPPVFHFRSHVRWHSADSIPSYFKDSRLTRKLRHSWDVARPIKPQGIGTVANAKSVQAVVRVFRELSSLLHLYEEYAAKYEMMVDDVVSDLKSISTKDSLDRGVEMLCRTLESSDKRTVKDKKAFTFGDLFIKPVQRICKYPLLFAELYKNTPVGDDPECHAELSKLLFCLRGMARVVNKAIDDPKTRDLYQKTWLLEERLAFPDLLPQIVPLRCLGHFVLCGVLYVTYHNKHGISGQYMLCVLFKSCVIMAIGNKALTSFRVVAIVSMVDATIEETDNGKGLQCHTTSHSWKLVFWIDYRLHEFLLSACSMVEATQWRIQLSDRIRRKNSSASDPHESEYLPCSSTSLNLKPISNLHGHNQTLSRRFSIRRAATMGPRSQMCQVIIRNTQSGETTDPSYSTTSLPMTRSQSLPLGKQIPVLAPRRSERIQLEIALSDVWTKDLLPFPGMKPLRIDHSFRASASSVMRKLSMVSMSSAFSRRSSSYTLSQTQTAGLNVAEVRHHGNGPHADQLRTLRSQIYTKSPAPIEPQHEKYQAPLVDFHNAPEMFLPPDFELRGSKGVKLPRKRQESSALYHEQSAKSISPINNGSVDKPQIERSLHRSSSLEPVIIPKSALPTFHSNGEDYRGTAQYSRALGGSKENISANGSSLPLAKRIQRLFK